MQRYKKYEQPADKRSMDTICNGDGGSSSSEFKLQVQQRFLKQYIVDNPEWSRLLLYHQIGSGKTCTAITLAETYKELNPDARVVVILPARLRTNFIDELVSPCGAERYLSKDAFDTYAASGTSQYTKQKIRAGFMKSVENSYSIISFERWKLDAAKASATAGAHGLKKWVKEFTKDTMIIVDEVHNLVTNTYDPKKWAEMNKTHTYLRAKGNAAMLFKYMSEHASSSCKILMLTATPIFDNIGQLKELVEVMDPKGGAVKPGSNISDVVGRLKDKVSYFPGTSPNSYPGVMSTEHEIPLSIAQDNATFSLQQLNSDTLDDGDEAFMLKQRQISISATKQSSIAVKDLKEMAPKIGVLVREIERAKKAKHIVYSSFVGSGLHIVAEALEARGWINVREIYRDPEMWSEYSGKVFAVWDGKTKDTEKQWIKGVANSKENMYGVKIRVILGSPSMKEGVSFKHIQHMHLLDPMWNQSARMQVEGRAIRFCSHVDMPADKRTVNVHTYKIVPREGGLVESTCDQIIYDIIIPRKQAMVEAGEAALKLNALDFKLFKRLYKVPSKAEAEVMKNIVIHKHRNAKTSCPRKRRPFLDTCPNGNHLKKNPKGDDCCYKDAKVRAKKQRDAATTCPKVRRPDEEGNCKAGFMSRKNNHGDDCCYKNK